MIRIRRHVIDGFVYWDTENFEDDARRFLVSEEAVRKVTEKFAVNAYEQMCKAAKEFIAVYEAHKGD